jgi:hypothetical protein
MTELFVPHQEALEISQLGFDEPCLMCWYKDNPNKLYIGGDERGGSGLATPLYSQAFKWFRSKYDIACYVETKSLTTGGNTYDYTILVTKGDEWDDGKRWKTYEEAELACLRKLIELVKQKP